MASNLSCIGLDVADQAEFSELIHTVLPTSRRIGLVAGLEVRCWDDPSGARLVLGLRNGEIVDFLPSFAGRPGVRFTDCRPLNADVVSAAVVDEDGEQTTAMAFELEQRRALDPVAPVSGFASLSAFGQDITLHDDEAAFGRSRRSLMNPDADLDKPPPDHIASAGLQWPIRYSAESFISYGVFGDPAAAEAYARLNGIVLSSERRRTSITGHSFVLSRVRVLGFEVDVLLDRHAHPDPAVPGQVLAGTVFLVASIEALRFDHPVRERGRRNWRLRKG